MKKQSFTSNALVPLKIMAVAILLMLALPETSKADSSIDSNCIDTCSATWISATSDPESITINFDECWVIVNYRYRTNCQGQIEIVYDDIVATGNCPCIDFRYHTLIAKVKARIAAAHVPGNQGYVTRMPGSCYTWYYIWVPKSTLNLLKMTNELINNPNWNDDPNYFKMKKLVPCNESCCITEMIPVPDGSGGYDIQQNVIYSGECTGEMPTVNPVEDFCYWLNGVWTCEPVQTEVPDPSQQSCEVICTNNTYEPLQGEIPENKGDIENANVSIEKIIKPAKITPIPFRYSFDLEITSTVEKNEGQISIFSSDGKLVFSEKVNIPKGKFTKTITPPHHIKSGTYILQLELQDQKSSLAIIKQ